MKKYLVFCVTLCLLMCMLLSVPFSVQAKKTTYGLTVSEDGTIQMDGKAFYGVGGNAFWLLERSMTDPFYDLEEVFKTFAAYDIPVVRVPFGTSGETGFTMWRDEPEMFFFYLDRVVAYAEQYHVGLIATITWWLPFIHYTYDEKASDIGDPNSDSYKFAMAYTEAIVKRYSASPAIFGWEISNELNLCADLFGRTEWAMFANALAQADNYDFYSTGEALIYMEGMAKVIRKNDPHGRMISNGNAKLPANQMSKKVSSDNMDKSTHSWSTGNNVDTLAEFYQISDIYTPDPIDTMSIHIGRNEVGYGDFTCAAWGRTVTYKEYLLECVNAAKKAKEALYLGEFGDLGEKVFDTSALEENKRYTKQFLDDALAAGVQLATCWQFAFNESDVHQINDDFPLYTYLLGLMQKANQNFTKDGKQDIDGYWNSVSNAFYNVAASTTTTKKSATTTTAKSQSSTSKQANATTTTSAPADTTGSTVADTDVSRYMVSASTKLSIHADTNTIEMASARTLDVFARSIALRDGYTMKVYDADGNELTDSTAQVTAGMTVKVWDPSSTELRTFSVTVTQAETNDTTTTTAPSAPTGNDPLDQSDGFPVWGWILIAVGVVVIVGGVTVVVVMRKRSSAS